jgi:hypothetical protein
MKFKCQKSLRISNQEKFMDNKRKQFQLGGPLQEKRSKSKISIRLD